MSSLHSRSHQFARNERPTLDRRALIGSALGGALSLPALGRLGPAAAARGSSLQGEGVRGGALRIAMAGEPPTLDIHQTTAGIVSFITWSMYEPLFTYDESYQLIPMLAESHEVSDDGLTNVLRLRSGVPFHNGEEMTAADVIASITRWGALSGLGQGLLDATDEMREVDAQTVEFHMKRPYGTFASSLAISYQGCAIYPKSVIDAAGDTPLEDTFIGTGPYQFAERVIDQYVRLTRFDDYAAIEGEPVGYGGHKTAYLDQIDFVPVADEASRIAGLQAGDYHLSPTSAPTSSRPSPRARTSSSRKCRRRAGTRSSSTGGRR